MNKLDLPKRKGCPEPKKASSYPGGQKRLCQKEKEQSFQSRILDRELGESQGEREPRVEEKEESLSESMESKASSPKLRKMGFQEERRDSKENLF